MEKCETIAAHDNRAQAVYADEDHIVVRVLHIPEADYECVMVNGSRLERGLLEGLISLFPGRDNPAEGQIVSMGEDPRTGLGAAPGAGYVQRTQGGRPLEWSGRI